MRAHTLSASKLDLAYLCQYSFRGDVVVPDRPAGEKAVRGTAVHLAAERYHRGEPLPELDEEGAALWRSLKGWLEASPRYNHSELALLYDAETDTATQCVMGDGARDYQGVGPMKLPMRLDLVRERMDDDEVWVCELKTGAKSNTAPAPVNSQIATQAVGASRFFGVNRVNVGLIFPMKTKVHAPEWHLLDGDALDEHAGKIHRVLKLIPDSKPIQGDHCFRCNLGPGAKGIAATCPAWVAARNEADTHFEGAAQ